MATLLVSTVASAPALAAAPAPPITAVRAASPHATISPPFESFISGVTTFTATDVSDDLALISLWDHATGREVARATAAPWTLTWDTRGRTGGAQVHFELTGKSGKTSFLYGFYALDNTGPTIARVEFPVVDGRVSGRSRLTAFIDARSPLDRVEWRVDGTLRSTYRMPETGLRPAPFFDWDTRGQNRTAVLDVRAYDILGQHTTLTRRVTVDNTGPRITAMTPGHRALVRGGQFRTTVSGSDPSGVREAYLLDAYTVTTAPFTVLASAGPDGVRTLTWTLTDRLGNQNTARRTVVVDNTKPKLKITKAPANRAKVKGTVKVAVSATDRNGINRVELLINGKVVAKDVKAPHTFSVKTKKFGKKIKVQVRVYDRAGNVTKSAVRTWKR
ncbi:Ig-like domain-containing protein [Actinoplanes missouriensis]|uniref:Ig-like domain-containing protein n=1 Tax=Actinoplanes missouriensis TaxID=1866 RepID=UPI00340AECF9